MTGTLTVKPGETVTVVGIPADAPLPPYIPGPVDPGYSPPWAQIPPGGQGGGPVDPGYSPPWARPRPPVAGWPVVPGWGGSLPGGGGFPGQGGPVDPGYSPPWAQVPGGGGDGGPVDPGYSPPWAQIPEGEDPGNWCWAYSPQTKRWMWVRVPGEGEAGPK